MTEAKALSDAELVKLRFTLGSGCTPLLCFSPENQKEWHEYISRLVATLDAQSRALATAVAGQVRALSDHNKVFDRETALLSEIGPLRAKLAEVTAKRDAAGKILAAREEQLDAERRLSEARIAELEARQRTLLDTMNEIAASDHADTCSHALDAEYDCDCHRDTAAQAIKSAAQTPAGEG